MSRVGGKKIKRSVTQLPNVFRNFSLDVFLLVGGQVLIAVVALISSALIARQLGVEDRGFLVIALLLPNTLIAFSDFGIGWAGIKFIAGKKWPASTVFLSNVVFMIVRIIVITLIGLVVIHFYSGVIFAGVPSKYLYMGLLQIVSLAVQGMMLPLLLGFDKARLYSAVLLYSSLLSIFVLVVTWQMVGLSVELIIIPQAMTSLIISTYIICKLMSFLKEKSKPSFNYLKEAFRFGFGIHFSYMCHFASDKLVLLVLNSFGGVIYVSLHTIAQSLTERLYLITDAVGTVLFPNIAAENSNSHSVTPFVFKITGILITSISIILMLMAEWVINFVYSSEYRDAVDIMRVLLVSTVFASLWNIISNDINARGFSKEIGYINLLLAVISLSITFWATQILGMIGAAFGALVGYFVALSIGLILFLAKTEQVTAAEMFFFSPRERKMLKVSYNKVLRRHD